MKESHHSVITLVGYMGAGKTMIGRLLAKKMGWSFSDLDAVLETNSGQSVRDLFRDKGELFFRKLERETLETLLDQEECVISTGGGTPCYFDTMKTINQKSHSVYLQAAPKLLSKRLFRARSYRPLIQHIDHIQDLEAFVTRHLLERQTFYALARLSLPLEGQSPAAIAHNITQHYSSLTPP